MKKINIYITIFKIFLDFFIVFGMFFIAREIRLVTDLIPSISLPIQTISAVNLIPFAILWAFVLIIMFSVHKIYRFDSNWGRIKEFSNIIIYSFYSFVFFTVIVHLWEWFLFDVNIPRLIIAFSYFLASISLIFERLIISIIKNHLFKKGLIKKQNIFIINNKISKESKQLIESFKTSYDYNIIWVSNILGIKYLMNKKKSFVELQKLIKKRRLDEILYVSSNFSKDELFDLWELSMIFWVKYRYMANSFDLAKTNTTMSLINGFPALEIWNTTLSWKNTIIKRIFDICFSICFLVLLFPVFIILAILIKIDDPKWPVIFKNKRVWKWACEFNVYKFRYMKWKYCTKEAYHISKTEKNKLLKYEENLIKQKSIRKWPLYKIKNDPRVTKIGRFIEKYSFDEIPQFMNVLLWNMSIIWPRPHQSREVKKYHLKHKMLLTIKPGITWMAQVNWREENNFDYEAKLDLYYIENWSLLLDLKILFKTIYVVLKRK